MNYRNLGRTLVAACCGLSLQAGAQQSINNFELEQLDFNPASRGGMLVGGSDLLPQGQGRMSLMLGYQNDPLRYYEQDVHRADLVEHRWTATLAGAYSLTRWLEVGALVPVMFSQNGQTVRSDDGTIVINPIGRDASIGTPWLQARLGMLRENDGGPFDLGFGISAGLPVGNSANLTRDPHLLLRPKIAAGKSFNDAWRISAEVGVMLRRGGRSFVDVIDATPGDEIASRIEPAIGVSTLGQGIRGELSARAYIPTADVRTGVELMAGGRAPLGGLFEIFALAGPGFGDSPGTPAFRGIVGLALGGLDRCQAGKAHDVAKCPDLDLDGDGIANRADQCATVPGVEAFAGCPPKDTDGDGLTDDVDACVTEAGPSANKGCPYGDADTDGVVDPEDACPNEAGPAENKGCPFVDTDGDGIVDPKDACPNEAGVAEHGGCPAPKQVELKADRIEVKGTVYFDTAKASIQEKSFSLLKEVAQVLRAHPEISKLSIDGHTDNTGSAVTNQKLSEARAASVRDFLVQEGVAIERLVPRGFGMDKPIADNKTKDGRNQNRRVEFLIMGEPAAQ